MTKKTFIIIDAMNMFFRSAHAISPNAGIDAQIGMSFHIMLNCLRKSWNDYAKGTDAHIVFCLEGRSWRKDYDAKYKLNRIVERMSKTEAQQENSEIMLEAFNDFANFIKEKTNVTTLRCPVAEADDLIAFWIDSHPDDNHVIISSDSDFYQLIAPNVQIYNGPQKFILTHEGFFKETGKPMFDKKTKLPMPAPDPGYYLFLKCIRGDKTDNIFSAYPGIREKGTKNKVGVIEAYADRQSKGYKWNNFMLQRWIDENEVEHVVKDKYEHNKLLIDLRLQPEKIKVALAETIAEALNEPEKSNVGIHFMKFCTRWSLERITTNAKDYATMLNARYKS